MKTEEGRPQSKKRLENTSRYIIKAERGAVCVDDSPSMHPRYLKLLVEKMEGVEIIDDELPFAWLIEATDEGVEKFKQAETGWSVHLETTYPLPNPNLKPKGGPS